MSSRGMARSNARCSRYWSWADTDPAYQRQNWLRKSKSRISYCISTNELGRKARTLESPMSPGLTQHRGLVTSASTACSVRKRRFEKHLLIREPVYREPELIDL